MSEKFAEFYKLIEAVERGEVDLVVTTPKALGDTYEELLDNLQRLARTGVKLALVPESD